MAKPILDDELWALIQPLLPPPKARRARYPGRKSLDDRAVLTGILFVLQSGIPWEMLPKEIGCGFGMSCWPSCVWRTASIGQQLKCLTVIDEYTRECLALDVAGSIRSKRVIEVLSQLASVHGAPRYLRSNNGPEFVSHAILKWAAENGLEMALSDPGKPWQNGADESFNGKFRDECLSLEWFRTRLEAKVVIEQWRGATTMRSGHIRAWRT